MSNIKFNSFAIIYYIMCMDGSTNSHIFLNIINVHTAAHVQMRCLTLPICQLDVKSNSKTSKMDNLEL